MQRYYLYELFTQQELYNAIYTNYDDDALLFGVDAENYEDALSFIISAVYGYFYDDIVVYKGDNESDVKDTFVSRFGYDIVVKLPYWTRKYNEIKKLLTNEQLSLMQTSKVTSNSHEYTDTASGSLQKTATTPTGVSTGTQTDTFDINIDSDGQTAINQVKTTGFADKYSNAQQKFANSGKVNSNRNGNITREGSIDELLNILEKLPSSFADEITRDLQKHFIFDYDGEEQGIYEEGVVV